MRSKLHEWLKELSLETVKIADLTKHGFPGYFINNRCIVYNQSTHPRAKPICKYYTDKDGYHRVWLKNLNGRKKFVTVHKLMALSFIGFPPPRHVVNHKDGNRKNNMISNLEWVLPADNERHARKVLGKRLLGEKASRSKLKSKEVLYIFNTKIRSQAHYNKLSKKFKVSASQIMRIIHGKNWSHLTGAKIGTN